MSETHTLGTEAGATVDQGTCAHGQSDDDTCPECIREVLLERADVLEADVAR